MKILIITPMKKEFHCAREVFSASEIVFDSDFRFAEKIIKKNHIYILQCGFNALKSLQKYYELYGSPDILIDSGTCGGLRKGIIPRDLFNVTKVIRVGSPPFLYRKVNSLYKLPEATIIEVKNAVDDEDERSRLAVSADICSMESYTLCLEAEKWNCLCYSFRVVTDLADSEMMSNFKLNFRESCLKLYGFINTFLNDLSH